MNNKNLKLRDVFKALSSLPRIGRDTFYTGQVHNLFEDLNLHSHVQGLVAHDTRFLMTYSDSSSGLIVSFNRTGDGTLLKVPLPHLGFGFSHPGGCQIIGDCLVIPVETAPFPFPASSYICFFDVSDPRYISEINKECRIHRPHNRAGAAGITNFTKSGSEYWLLCAYDNGNLDFYHSAANSFPGSFSHIGAQHLTKTEFQTVCLFTDTTDRVFLIGLQHKNDTGNAAFVYLVIIDNDKVTLEPIASPIQFTTTGQNDTDYFGAKPSFRWGAGIDIVSETELALFCSERLYDDGCHVNTFALPHTTSFMGTECDDNHEFSNWANSLHFQPKLFCQPHNDADVSALIDRALKNGTSIRPQGAEESHTWSHFVFTRDTLTNLDKMNGVGQPAFDGSTGKYLVEVQAGIRLKDLVTSLAGKSPSLGLVNLGTIKEQSIAGATATGTHGTGITLGNLATQIEAITLVTGNKDAPPRVIPKGNDYFRAAAVSLGTLGIITKLTLGCVPNYDIRRTYYLCKFSDILEYWDTFLKNKRVRFWAFVPSSPDYTVLVTLMNPVDEPDYVPGRDILPGVMPELQMKTSSLLEECKKFIAPGLLGQRCYQLGPSVVGNYSNMLTFPVQLIPHHWECEYAVPVNNALEALNALKTVLDESKISLLLPLEIRFVARDNFLLSPAANDPRYPQSNGVCYIGAMTDKNATEVFQRFEPLMKQFGGRPHWGKHFTLTRSEMRDMYPGSYDDFNNIRKDLDPKGIFTNSLIHQLFDA
jgi:FAD/FMN-containing dehydrogenase